MTAPASSSGSPAFSLDGDALDETSAISRCLVRSLARSANRVGPDDGADLALRMLQAMRALRPAEEQLEFLQAHLLWQAGRIEEARDMLQGNGHPQARAMLAMCAVSLGDATCLELIHEAAASGDAQAVAIADTLREHLSMVLPQAFSDDHASH